MIQGAAVVWRPTSLAVEEPLPILRKEVPSASEIRFCFIRYFGPAHCLLKMEGKGREGSEAGQLSPDLIKELTGQDDLELIEEIEVIFNEVRYIGGLERCANLRSLTLIDTRLQCIDNLASVSMSLEKLMLTEQNIQKIEGLVLPNLRELYLQNNQISVLEGFENCPKLQRLWVFSNNITKVCM